MTATDFPVYFLKHKLMTKDAPKSVSTVSYFEKYYIQKLFSLRI